MLKIALKVKPKYVCIVPEKREEITTEGGLNLKHKKNYLNQVILKLKKNNIKVSLFIEPDFNSIHLAKELGADSVELHTGKYCNNFRKKNIKNIKKEYLKIKKSAMLAATLKLDVHAGHGLDYQTSKNISKIKQIEELNIGHFFISESIFFGIANVLKKFNKILKR
jgi:pyridoxine 5-phosphate synthase